MIRINIFENQCYNESMTYKELRRLDNRMLSLYANVEVEGNDFRINIREKRLLFAGRKHFIKNIQKGWISYQNGKVSGNPLVDVMRNVGEKREEILQLLGIEWIKDLHFNLLDLASRKTIAVSIFNKKIYNQETLVKAIGKRLYNLRSFSWKIFRDYIVKTGCMVSVCNIRDFTANVDHTMRRIVEANVEERRLLSDIIYLAAKDDLIVNARWSTKRLEEEHSKQIRRIEMESISAKDIKNIYSDDAIQRLNSETIKLLCNEKEVFMEGLNMHHCIYSCYWDGICGKAYMAFHMYQPEDCTFGVTYLRSQNSVTAKEEKRLGVEQIYLKYDKPVSEETRKIADEYVDRNSECIKEMLSNKESYKDYLYLPF